jgi:hypothetical protein
MKVDMKQRLFKSFFLLLAIGLLFAVSACFRVVEPEGNGIKSPELVISPVTNQTPLTLPPFPATWTGVQFKFFSAMEGGYPGERFGSSLGYLGEIDGDNTPDIAVGAPLACPANKSEAGSVYVVSVRIARALYRLDGQYTGDRFGTTLAVVGDLDGDKIADFIVGAPLGDVQGLPDAGYVMLYSAKEGKLLDYYTGIEPGFRLGHSAAGLGDLNGDGFPDFAIGTPYAKYNGKENAGAVMIEISKSHPLKRTPIVVYGEGVGDNFGWSIAGIGDVNRDNIPDILVGAPGLHSADTSDIGRIYVLSGENGTVLYKIDGKYAGYQFGFSVSGMDDINGDNLPDIIVGAPQTPPLGDTNLGKAFVFSGKDGTLIYEMVSSPPGSLFGYSVASGDVDGDNRADIVVGDPGTYGGHGSVHVFSGRDGKRFLIFTNNPNRREEIGFALGPVEDVNSDNRGEIIIGAAGAMNIEGKPSGRLYILIKP